MQESVGIRRVRDGHHFLLGGDRAKKRVGGVGAERDIDGARHQGRGWLGTRRAGLRVDVCVLTATAVWRRQHLPKRAGGRGRASSSERWLIDEGLRAPLPVVQRSSIRPRFQQDASALDAADRDRSMQRRPPAHAIGGTASCVPVQKKLATVDRGPQCEQSPETVDVAARGSVGERGGTLCIGCVDADAILHEQLRAGQVAVEACRV